LDPRSRSKSASFERVKNFLSSENGSHRISNEWERLHGARLFLS
jgi:hypothetical protein